MSACGRAGAGSIVPAVAYALVFAAVLVYGVLSPVDTSSARQWKVALVQQNIDPWRGGYIAYRDSLQVLVRQSEKALESHPELVAWSETSFVPPSTGTRAFALISRSTPW